MPANAVPCDDDGVVAITHQPSADTTMMADMQKMFELGLSLTNIERMWKDVPTIDMAKVQQVGEKLLVPEMANTLREYTKTPCWVRFVASSQIWGALKNVCE